MVVARDAPWTRDPAVLWRRPAEFFPARDMAPAERLNALVRFILYATAMVAALRYARGQPMGRVLAAGAAAVLVASAVAGGGGGDGTSTGAGPRDVRCTRPTPDNPFMNRMPGDPPDKPPPCDDPEGTARAFEHGLVREVSDVYKNRASDRQFATVLAMPDTGAFANFLFPNTAKGVGARH